MKPSRSPIASREAPVRSRRNRARRQRRLQMGHVRKGLAVVAVAGIAVAVLAACQSASTAPPLPPAPQVDIERYMGDWYVLGNIPTWPEKNAYDAVENYKRRDDGRIATTFTYRDGGFEEPVKQMHPVGTVVDKSSNAIWTMQFMWPFQADYRILYINPEHTQVVVGREKRDYVWIMARTPTLSEADYARLKAFVAAQGYDTSKLRDVPQRPLAR